MKALGWNSQLSAEARKAFDLLQDRAESITDSDLTADDLSVIDYIDSLLKTKMKKANGIKQ